MSKVTRRQGAGRPPLPAGEGKRYAVGIRTTKELRDRLAAASEASGRSIAQEIESRLERSFEDPLGDPRSATIFKALGDIARQVAAVRRDHWLDDYEAFQAIVDRWNDHLQRIAPPAPAEVVEHMERIFERIRDAVQKNDLQRARELAELIALGAFPDRLIRAYLARITDLTGIPIAELTLPIWTGPGNRPPLGRRD